MLTRAQSDHYGCSKHQQNPEAPMVNNDPASEKAALPHSLQACPSPSSEQPQRTTAMQCASLTPGRPSAAPAPAAPRPAGQPAQQRSPASARSCVPATRQAAAAAAPRLRLPAAGGTPRAGATAAGPVRHAASSRSSNRKHQQLEPVEGESPKCTVKGRTRPASEPCVCPPPSLSLRTCCCVRCCRAAAATSSSCACCACTWAASSQAHRASAAPCSSRFRATPRRAAEAAADAACCTCTASAQPRTALPSSCCLLKHRALARDCHLTAPLAALACQHCRACRYTTCCQCWSALHRHDATQQTQQSNTTVCVGRDAQHTCCMPCHIAPARQAAGRHWKRQQGC